MTERETTVFASIYETHYRHIYAYCRRRSNADSVDDLVADVFLTVWRKIHDAPDGEDAFRWLYRIAYLTVTKHWRGTNRQKKLEERLESIGIQPVPLIQDQVVIREEVREVLNAAQRLRARDVEVLRLSLWEHLSLEEIGGVLDITQPTPPNREFIGPGRTWFANTNEITKGLVPPLLRKEVRRER